MKRDWNLLNRKRIVVFASGTGTNFINIYNKIKDGDINGEIVLLISNNKIVFCYCISEYPTEFSKIKWKEAKKYDGFSDHTIGIIAPIVFSILKKRQGRKKIIIEKHIKLKNSKGPDASTSIDTQQLKMMVNNIRIIEKLKI